MFVLSVYLAFLTLQVNDLSTERDILFFSSMLFFGGILFFTVRIFEWIISYIQKSDWTSLSFLGFLSKTIIYNVENGVIRENSIMFTFEIFVYRTFANARLICDFSDGCARKAFLSEDRTGGFDDLIFPGNYQLIAFCHGLAFNRPISRKIL